ncbi:DUF443 domain-containing protein [Staphylococcus aureus]
MYLGHVKVLLGMFLSLKTLYRKRTVIWPFYFYTIIRTLSKLKLHIFDKNKSNNEKIILIPTFKNICLSLFAYILFGGLSTMALSMLVTSSPQNIIEFLALIGMTACFFLLNMSSVLDKKIHVILKTNK